MIQLRSKGPVINYRRGGGGLVQTCGGPLFFMQAQKGGSNNLGHVIKEGIIFYAKLLGSRSQSRIPL